MIAANDYEDSTIRDDGGDKPRLNSVFPPNLKILSPEQFNP